jgi:hypothetical protein
MERRLLSESLEQRQLLAGPSISGIQPSEGALLGDGTVLDVSPRELVFQFDDDTNLDARTLSAIRITQAGDGGAFDSATALTDLGTNGLLAVEFRSVESGLVGNGIRVEITANPLAQVQAPVITVNGRVLEVEVSSNPAAETTMQDLISAVGGDAEASGLVEVIQVSGSSLSPFGQEIGSGLTITLEGANSAEGVTDFGTGAVQVRFVSQTPGSEGLGTSLQFEQRNFGGPASPLVVVNGSTVLVQLNSTTGSESTAQELIDTINNDPAASALVSASLQQGDPLALIGASSALPSSLELTGVSDESVDPGYIGFGDSSREVIFRFAEPLEDDLYKIEIFGSGQNALRNLGGEAFQDGTNFTRQFSINLGPKVAAVVPEPVRRAANGELQPEVGKIEIHFNNDRLDQTRAEDTSYYALIFTQDTVGNIDDVLVEPDSVTYNSTTNIAMLDFGAPLSRLPVDPSNLAAGFLTGAARLRVGADINADPGLDDRSPFVAPLEIALDPVNQEPGDSFGTAFDVSSVLVDPVSSISNTSVRLTSEIVNTSSYGLDLPGPDMEGVRRIREDDPSRLDRNVPLDYVRQGADSVDGISVIQYNFPHKWVGDDPTVPGIEQDRDYFSIITEQQKDRVREALTQFSQYLGVNFVEVEGAPTQEAFISIVVGDLYGAVENPDEADDQAFSAEGGLAVATRDQNGDGVDDLAVLDFQDFDDSTDDTYGGKFFRGGMFAVGQLLGYGYADDLPQPVSQSSEFIFSPGTDNEAAYPSAADITHGQYLYRPEGQDIDLYRFEVPVSGKLSAETIAERLGEPSLLDSVIRVYQLGADGAFEEIAGNNDYFSNDSLIDIEVNAGTYMIGVSASGNAEYDPTIEGTGFGGVSEGEYELVLDFRPNSTTGLTDTTGIALDGDGDGRPGDVFNFWFVPADVNSTLYVDKAATSASGNLGTLTNPFREIDQAIAAATEGMTIRVVGNGGVDGRIETLEDNYSYQIGYTLNSLPLSDGQKLELPKGVRMVIDSGAILKMSRSRIGVGSASLVDQSDASLQLLGTPSFIAENGLPARDSSNRIIPGSVFITSINDDSIGAGNTTATGPSGGDWGGVDFRGDLDTADESRRNRESEGVFLNHIQYADLRYGGGQVDIGGQSLVVSPIDMAVTRPTIINSEISLSADAAMAATPDTFAETRFTDPYYQAGESFSPDYDRIGPVVWGNTIVDNSINGLFVRIQTRAGAELEQLTTAARFNDGDIPIVITENLKIAGTAGGPVLQSTAPSSILVQLSQVAGGDVPADDDTYVYRITNVDSAGVESASSLPTVLVTLTGGGTAGIQLQQLPLVGNGSGFTGRRLYRADVGLGGVVGEYRLVQELNASDSTALDQAASGTTLLSTEESVLRSRLDASLVVDPGTVVKLDGARIEATFGGNLIAEGAPGLPVVFTSLKDQRYGGGGTFNTNDQPESSALSPGDWGGIYVGQTGSASLDQAVVAGGGGTTRIEGGFASFNAIELHQGDLRLANTRLEFNADGQGAPGGDRVGRATNSDATVFVRAAQPVILDNEFVENHAPAISMDINSFTAAEMSDHGRATGRIDASSIVGNSGPFVQGNALQDNDINGMIVRGGQMTTDGTLDDAGMVHVVRDSIEIPNRHIFGGLRLESDARSSLVIKFESAENENAGIVVGGTLLNGEVEFRDIASRLGGSLQLLGQPDFPVVLTTLADDSVGAGFTVDGIAQRDTNGDGIAFGDLSNQGLGGLPTLPTGPEVNNGLTIDNDVDVNLPGFFEATIDDGADVVASGVTVEDLSANVTLINQDYIFAYSTYVTTATGVEQLSATTITQPATLIADDVVESRGNFAGPNGLVSWTATSSFVNGVSRLITTLDLDSGVQLMGDIQVVSYLDEDVGFTDDDIMVTTGTPGVDGFRVFTLDGSQRVGFSQGGYYSEDGLNQVNATYTGWAADKWADLRTAIAAGTQTYSIAGDIDLADLPVSADPVFGQQYGPADVTTAFAWNTNSTSTNAKVTTFLELLARDPAIAPPLFDFEAGLWDGVVIREGADDRNVAAFAETEPSRSGFVDTNAIPGQSQFLGELAPNEQSGDENRRLGFIVNGTVSQRDDIDVFSFVAESATEVWFDIDGAGSYLDSVIELVNVNGVVLASSNDSILAETDESAIYTDPSMNPGAAQQLTVVSQPLPVQQLTVDQTIANATEGELLLNLSGFEDPVPVLVEDFQADPARAVQAALAVAYPDKLATVISNPLQTNPSEDIVIQLIFDEQEFTVDSLPEITIDGTAVIGAVVTGTVSETLLPWQLQDDYSINAKDAGFRVVLPGELGTRNLYHVRVRASNTPDPLDFVTLNDPSKVRDGLTLGGYEMQIRLQEGNERAGTQVRLSEMRFATTGLQIIGQPLHSPLLGEDHETTATNDLLADAQPLGLQNVTGDATSPSGVLQSDKLAKSFSGNIDSATDVDWYRFDITYDNITREDAILYLSTVFDLDYAGGLARADMALYVFDGQGQLVLMGTDSNVAEDLPASAIDDSSEDLSRGSFSGEDPFIGTAELAEGTYFVAVSNQTQVPQPLDQFFDPNSLNPLLRLEPINSIRRVAEDHISTDDNAATTTDNPPLLFNDESILEHVFDDTLLYVNTALGLSLVNPATGNVYGSIGGLSDRLDDIAFRANGELFGYTDNDGLLLDGTGAPEFDEGVEYVRIDTGNGTLTSVGGMGLETWFDNGLSAFVDDRANVGIQVNAISIRDLEGVERGFLVGNRPQNPGTTQGVEYFDNLLYQFNDETGEIIGSAYPAILDGGPTGAATGPREIGQIDTDGTGVFLTQLGVTNATEINANGVAVPSILDGDQFTLSNGAETVTFEFDQGFTLFADGSDPVRDGDAIIVDGVKFEFETSPRILLTEVAPVGLLVAGTTLAVGDDEGVVTFEFTELGEAAEGNIAVSIVDGQGLALSADQISANLANAINAEVNSVDAFGVDGEVHFGDTPVSLSVLGPGIAVAGQSGLNDPAAITVPISATLGQEELIAVMAQAIRNQGFAVSERGAQLSLPNALSLFVEPDPTITESAFSIIGTPGVDPGNTSIFFLPTDTYQVVANRVESAVEVAKLVGDLPNVSATPNGRSLLVSGGFVVGATGNVVAGGAPNGGTITGVELVDDALFAVSDNGGLYRVSAGELSTSPGSRQVGTYVRGATDLRGINFSGLRAGPASVEEGALSDVLFGITAAGDVHAFNTNGEFQPVFPGGRSMIQTGIAGALGLDFSTIDFSLWHTTDTRAPDPGHGIDALPGGAREAVAGGTSLAFNYEDGAFAANFESASERPTAAPRLDGTAVASSFNVPGGAKGVVETNQFSLQQYSASDQPTLYFNYFAANDGNADRLRIHVITEDGAQHLVASNSLFRGPDVEDDEFDDPAVEGQYDDSIDVPVQQLFDNTGSWRQARIDLADFAGMGNLQMRIEYSTAGTTLSSSAAMRTTNGRTLANLDVREFVVEGTELSVSATTFVMDLAPTVAVPSGKQLAELYGSVYVSDGSNGVVLLDVSDRTAISELEVFDTTGNVQSVVINGTTSYVADGVDGLRILDVADPAAIVELGSFDTTDAQSIVIAGTTAYVADGADGLRVLDVTDPAVIVELGFFDTTDAQSIVIAGTTAYVADGADGLRILDVAVPAAIVELGSFDTTNAQSIVIAGTTAYVADGADGLRILDVADPAAIVELGSFDTTNAQSVVIAGTTAYVADGADGLRILDVADPAAITELGSFDTTDARSVGIAGTTAYVADGADGLRILDVTDPTAITELGSFDTTNAQAVATPNAVVTIDGKEYLLNDGTRIATIDQVDVDLFAGSPAGTTLDRLTSGDVADVLTAAIIANLPQNQTTAGVYLSDPDDLPPAVGQNDMLYEATQLPYSGGNLTVEGTGRLGQFDAGGLPMRFRDVDLLRLEVTTGTLVEVDFELVGDDVAQTPLDSVVRFFNANGDEVTGNFNGLTDKVEHTATYDGLLYIGLSGVGNEVYDPRIADSGSNGQLGTYTTAISMTAPTNYSAQDNLIEFAGGQQDITVSHPALFRFTDRIDSDAIRIPVSTFMSASEIAVEVRRALANHFVDGEFGQFPVAAASIRLPALSIIDAGPFHAESDRQGEQFADGAIEGTRDNAHEGIYLDDFVIGFAERGEAVTGSPVVDTLFTADLRDGFATPANPTSDLVTGPYTVEIRDGSEYINSLTGIPFRSFDTNERMSEALSLTARSASDIVDGDFFKLSNGREELEFEFDQVEVGNGVEPGRVAISFTLEAVDPVSGVIRPQTAAEVARNIAAAINRSDVQAVIQIQALPAEGVDSLDGNRIDLFGAALVENPLGVLESVDRTLYRGDENRDRDGQGVILVENSRFLFNEDHGILIDHGFTADVDQQVTPVVTRYPRNLIELNTESLSSGVVVQSSVIAFNDLGGLKIVGAPQGSAETFSDPVGYDRIVNNTIIGGDISPGRSAPPQTINGILFPSGLVSFADAIAGYDPSANGIPPTAIHQNTANALGAPDAPGIGAEPVNGNETVSLGYGGSLTVQFVDNLLSGNGNAQPDLVVFESGEIESVLVEISRDGVNYFDVGIVGGLANSLDIDTLGFGEQDRFAFVRLTDLRQGDPTSPSVGADIDAVGAISSAVVEAFNPSGIGVELVGNAAPVMLNNIISNSNVGIELDPTYNLPQLGGNSYYRNAQNITTDGSLGQFSEEVVDTSVLFFGAPTLVFAPAPNASIIDSSIDSLEDRSSLASVKGPLGLPVSPILSPDYDVNGALRVDDATVQTPSGMGESVFKDRGAFDRGDAVGPRVVLVTPRAPDLGAGAGVAEVLGEIPQYFEFQFIDGIAPADVAPGTGIDDYSISRQSVLLLKDGIAQVEGVDFRFGYNSSTNVVRLTPVAGAWEPASTYVIRMVDGSDAVVQAGDGDTYSDGEQLNVFDAEGLKTTFEYETGLTVRVNPLILDLGLADGLTMEVFDGVSSVTFELDDNTFSNPLNTVIDIPGTVGSLTVAIADAINASGLNLSAIAQDNAVQLLGSNPLASVETNSSLVSVEGELGVAVGFGLLIPNDGADISNAVQEGQTFGVRQGSLNTVTFELDSDNNVQSNDDGVPNVSVPFNFTSTLDQLADAIVLAIGQAPLGLDPSNAGFGRVVLGGDANYSVDLADTVLTQLGFPGDAASKPITILLDSTEAENVQLIAEAIDAEAITGVTTTVVDRRIFLEGTLGVSGVGSVEVVPVRDEVGNQLQSNNLSGRTELIIYVGGGYDYGDAPSPYLTTMADGGPRHGVEQSFALSTVGSERAVTADSEPHLDNLDEDNGVNVTSALVAGFTGNLQVSIVNDDNRDFYLDAWFDWDQSGTFDADEAKRYGSVNAPGIIPITSGDTTIGINIPGDSEIGEIYSRFRLSEVAGLGPNGDAASGEVEDWALVVESNPFQNPAANTDVNASGATTPIDGLQIINALARNGGDNIFLDVLPLPANLPTFPDVNGDGKISSLDSLLVLNKLSELYNSGSGEGESSAYVPIAGGVMASATTVLGDDLLRREADEADEAASLSSVGSSKPSVSVFDSPAVVDLDEVVESLAVDAASVRDIEDTNSIDALFASL